MGIARRMGYTTVSSLRSITMNQKNGDDYRLTTPSAAKEIEAPKLPYQPRDPKDYRPQIGLIACGEITKDQLAAYRKAGYRGTAMCDPVLHRARKRKTEFYPDARVCRDYHDLRKRDDVNVVRHRRCSV